MDRSFLGDLKKEREDEEEDGSGVVSSDVVRNE